ncbi:MAG: hypothetical protein HC915_05985 [Anaerolineae bacterium]|nr:hypothetical protein [Anaerolineae bacterium]
MFKALWRGLRQPGNLIVLALCLVPIYLVHVYIQSYYVRVPQEDQWSGSAWIAVATRDGTLGLDELLSFHGGHRHFYNNLTTALLTATGDWSITAETYINLVLAVLNFSLLLVLVHKAQPELVRVLGLPFALLIFALSQYNIWLIAYYATWQYVPLFLLLSLVALVYARPGWGALLAVGVLAALSGLAFGTGAVIWFVLPGVMVLQGGWRPVHFLVYGLWAALNLYFYLGVGVEFGGDGQSDAWNEARFEGLQPTLEFTLTYLGGLFAFGELRQAQALGLVGVLGLGLNALAVLTWGRWAALRGGSLWPWVRGLAWREVAIWLALPAFAVGSALAASLGRLTINGVEGALETRYYSTALYFWAGWLTLGALLAWRVGRATQPRTWPHLLLTLNALLMALLAAFWMRTNVGFLQWQYQEFGTQAFGEARHEIKRIEECFVNFPLERGEFCRGLQFHGSRASVYRLAAYRLTHFARYAPVNILPPTYEGGSPVILSSPNIWLNAFVREQLLAGLDEAALLHAAPADGVNGGVEDFRPVLDDVLPALTPQTLPAVLVFVADAPQVWLISTPETAEADAVLFEALEARATWPRPIRFNRSATAWRSSACGASSRHRRRPKRCCALARRTFGWWRGS